MSEIAPLTPGLYLVATPIGNLGDITLRALDVLRAADIIACEDTRQTQKLLNHFAIDARTVSYHEHNERERSAQLIEAIQSGKVVALVSDAGTPVVSDPGGWLIQEAIAAGIPVIPIPGANAALTALIASGLPATEFTFLGFLPEKAGARRTCLEDLAAEFRTARTVIFYEAPHRIADTLADLESIFGPTLRVVAARELTKLHEEFLRGTVAEVRTALATRDRIRGEFVLVIEIPARSTGAPGPEQLGTGVGTAPTRESISTRIARLHTEEGLDEKDALKRLARETGQSKSELYRELQRERARRK
ncbi:MAG TPA: 16S rRNA (cytidine(1402)-2'-O)-methyltransferase [Terracidiphilus sp.]|nr:16S rRNA (cytidine(1402)-2'-O)-methyltransferase [Terracidiphilus sp.]